MPLTAEGSAPYAPPATVVEILKRFRDRGLQTPITTDVLMRAGVPETLAQRVLQTLKGLEFLDEGGEPSPTFAQLQRAPENEYRQGLADMLKATYAEVYQFADPAEDGMDRLRDAFRPFNPRGQQERMITLFLGLCEYVGADVSAAMQDKRAVSEGGAQRQRSQTPRKATGSTTKSTATKKTKDHSPPPPPPLSDGLPPALLGLLQQIPKAGAGWTEQRRGEFLAAFGAVLDFSVPVREHEPEPTVGDENEVSTS
jgi:hypothetical protein